MSDVSACHVSFLIDTPPKINIEPENEGWEEDVPFLGPVFSGSSRSSSRGVKQIAVENPCSSGRWFQICFIFTLTWGRFPIWLQPGKLTWNLKITQLKRKIIFQTIIFRFHVILPGFNIFQMGWFNHHPCSSKGGFDSHWCTPSWFGCSGDEGATGLLGWMSGYGMGQQHVTTRIFLLEQKSLGCYMLL